MLFFLMDKYNRFPTLENKLALRSEELSREYFDIKFSRVALALGATEAEIPELMTVDVKITNHQCKKLAIETFEEECRSFSDYGLKYIRFLVTVCESGASEEFIMNTIKDVCLN